MGGVTWLDGGWVWVVSYGKTESGDGCRQMVGRWMGMGGVIW